MEHFKKGDKFLCSIEKVGKKYVWFLEKDTNTWAGTVNTQKEAIDQVLQAIQNHD